VIVLGSSSAIKNNKWHLQPSLSPDQAHQARTQL